MTRDPFLTYIDDRIQAGKDEERRNPGWIDPLSLCTWEGNLFKQKEEPMTKRILKQPVSQLPPDSKKEKFSRKTGMPRTSKIGLGTICLQVTQTQKEKIESLYGNIALGIQELILAAIDKDFMAKEVITTKYEKLSLRSNQLITSSFDKHMLKQKVSRSEFLRQYIDSLKEEGPK